MISGSSTGSEWYAGTHNGGVVTVWLRQRPLRRQLARLRSPRGANAESSASQAVQLALLASGCLCAVWTWTVDQFRPCWLWRAELPPEVAAASPIVESARFWVPTTIAIFTVLAGVAGGLTSRVMEWWTPGRRVAMTWLSFLGLFLSFWLPFLLTTNLILHGGVGTAWILPGSLLLPAILIAGTAWWLVDDLRLPGAFRRRGGSDVDAYDPLHHRPRGPSTQSTCRRARRARPSERPPPPKPSWR